MLQVNVLSFLGAGTLNGSVGLYQYIGGGGFWAPGNLTSEQVVLDGWVKVSSTFNASTGMLSAEINQFGTYGVFAVEQPLMFVPISYTSTQ